LAYKAKKSKFSLFIIFNLVFYLKFLQNHRPELYQ